jgi:hypothetical protein
MSWEECKNCNILERIYDEHEDDPITAILAVINGEGEEKYTIQWAEGIHSIHCWYCDKQLCEFTDDDSVIKEALKVAQKRQEAWTQAWKEEHKK